MTKTERNRVNLFGVEIDRVRMSEAISRVLRWIHDEPVERCRYVVTPNTDHAVMLRDHVGLRLAYDDADLVTADGMPIVVASRMLGRPLPERVAGSDFVPRLLASATPERPFSVFLLGAMPGVGNRARAMIEDRWPSVSVVGVNSPPLGFEHDAEECDRILDTIADINPDVLVVGLGAPKQELWVHRHRDRLRVKVALCAGATIDFLAGDVSRAPVWMRRSGLEWLHRLASDPGRLLGRYSRDAIVFPQIVWDELRSSRRRNIGES